MTAIQQTERFTHPALFYRGDQEYLAGLVPFIEEGLSLDEPVAMAVPADRLALLRDALGPTADGVRMLDMTRAGRNPGRIIPGVLRQFADQHTGGHVRIIGEPIWPGRTDREYPACVQHEALINLAFTGRDVTIVCPYDADGLDSRTLMDAVATHPVLWEGDRRSISEQYAPERVVADYNQELPAPAEAPTCVVNDTAGLAFARQFVATRARELGLAGERVEDLTLMINELASNSLAHAGSSCRIRIWREGADVIAETGDSGYLRDPLAGRRPTEPGQLGGRGLLLVNHLADLVRTHTTPTGTTIQIHCHIR
ncbi:MAG TPA: sensor histidine kinase [Amycolatopsis sp.]|uniref:sensor histidine kinase n=1 Tax=Amycolatopsis sp. TaxID=37632 RepID=UPI002B460259|nr:sensor histidine kinase [Amycolatopsis sp.]HKS44070.1 sensor histidine kinase [Amycolatopsis sp.]